jgi:hypothetical protein
MRMLCLLHPVFSGILSYLSSGLDEHPVFIRNNSELGPGFLRQHINQFQLVKIGIPEINGNSRHPGKYHGFGTRRLDT